METWGPANFAVMIPIVAILGAFAYIIVLTVMRSRVRELEIRQRIALIERGLVPPPEADPRAFEQAMTRLDTATQADCCVRANRHRRAGITLMGVGFGLILLISIAGNDPQAGVGVGGFLVVVGLAFLANAWFEQRSPVRSTPPSTSGPSALPPPAAHPE